MHEEFVERKLLTVTYRERRHKGSGQLRTVFQISEASQGGGLHRHYLHGQLQRPNRRRGRVRKSFRCHEGQDLHSAAGTDTARSHADDGIVSAMLDYYELHDFLCVKSCVILCMDLLHDSDYGHGAYPKTNDSCFSQIIRVLKRDRNNPSNESTHDRSCSSFGR